MSGADSYEFTPLAEITTKVALEAMQNTLESKVYNAAKSSDYVEVIGSVIVERMKGISPNFKYVVSTFIIEKVGAGVHYESVSHWDAKTDGAITTKYENDTMICLCSVFGLAI